MSSHPELLKSIIDSPDDDGPRLAYADWLQGHEPTRAEFIRLQCSLARMTADDPAQ